MKCWSHKWSKWSEPYNSQITRTRGSFGKTSTDDVVRQDRICEKCGYVQSNIIRDGRLPNKETA